MSNHDLESKLAFPYINYCHILFDDEEMDEVDSILTTFDGFNKTSSTFKTNTIKSKVSDSVLNNTTSPGFLHSTVGSTGGYVETGNSTVPYPGIFDRQGTGDIHYYDTYKQWPYKPFIDSTPLTQTTLRFKETYLIDKIITTKGIELVYKISKYPPSHELQDSDEVYKEIYEIQYGKLVFMKKVTGKYVPPKPATYDFKDE